MRGRAKFAGQAEEFIMLQTGILAGITDYFTWWQGLLALALVVILVGYKMYRDKQV